jgi:two-component SAPR family response regulator
MKEEKERKLGSHYLESIEERLRKVLLQLAVNDMFIANWQTLKFLMQHFYR